MKILIDIGHPKNSHIMGKLAPVLEARGHVLHYIYRERERLGELCTALGLNGESRGRGADGWLGKVLYLIRADYQLSKLAKQLRPDLLLSFGSPYLAHVARLFNIPMVVFDDTEDNRLVQRIYVRSASIIVVPVCFGKDLGSRQRRFDGYYELAYLHPGRFSPDPAIRNELGLPGGEKFVLLRIVAWKAVHDLKHKGISKNEMRLLVDELSKLARVIISAEGELPPGFEPYRLRLPPERIHHVLAHASLVFSEGATMAAEAAVLGVPTVHVSDLKPGYISHLESRHGLLRSFPHKDLLAALETGREFLASGAELKATSRVRRERMLAESDDVTQVMLREIEGCGPSGARELPGALR